MKKVNFKNSVMIAIMAIGMVMVSCGGRSGNQQSGTATTETKTEQAASAVSELRAKDVNVSNWQAVIKATKGGVDISLPDGWTVRKTDYSGLTVFVDFNIGGSTTGEQFAQMLFDATKAVSQNGNHKVEITERGVAEGEAIGTIGEAAVIAGQSAYNWCFTETSEYKYTHQINYSFSADNKQAALSF